MSVVIAVDESKITEITIKIERARVLSNTLIHDYFEQEVKSPKDFWKLSGFYYDNARIILETVLDLVGDAEYIMNKVADESKVIRGGGQNKWLRNFSILMARDLREMKLAVIIYVLLKAPMAVESECMYTSGSIITGECQ